MADRSRKPRKRRRIRKTSFGLWFLVAIAVLIGFFLWTLDLSRPHVTGDTLRLDVFLNKVTDGDIKTATLLDADGYVVGRYERDNGTTARYNAPYLKTSLADLVDMLIGAGIPVTVDQQNDKRVALLAATLIPFLIITLLFVYLILSYRRGTGLFAIKSGARKAQESDKKVTFADVAGQDQAIAELRELVSFLKEPERFATVGASIPKGILLYGPPGCGKTLMAKALASESGASFYSISGSDFVEMYVGVGASRVRDLFREAREDAPAVIFIDELDSIGRARGMIGAVSSHSEQEQALNQILAEMDGFSPAEGVIVIGATNRPDILDQALLRPGRFDRTIGLERPDEKARLAILSLHATGKPLGAGVDLADVARRAIGLTGADLAAVMNEAALLAGRANRVQLVQSDLDQALSRILAEPERQRRLAMKERGIGKRFVSDDRITFEDVAGVDPAIRELQDVREYLASPERFIDIGAQVPKGILLVGPPGCGKTLLARAVAGESNAAFYSVSASEFVEVFVGEGASRVREMFAEAKAAAPAIIFIDEIDAIGVRRGSDHHGNREVDQTLNQFLVEMDGFEAAAGVIVMAATNRPDMLDPALVRPGRFDRTVAIERPDEAGRLDILRLHAKGKKLAPEVDLAPIAAGAIGLTGADLAAVLNEAALLATRAGHTLVAQGHLQEALKKILEAPERQRRMAMRGRGIGKRFVSEDRITFDDVAGVDEAIEELNDVRDYLANPERFAKIGARVPRGILLVGSPGCGKTLLARAVAGEANAAFFSVSASEFVQVFVGEGAARVRDLFAEARGAAPAIIFIDEIDAIGGARSAAVSGGQREYEQTLNQFLVEMDGFDSSDGVIVMAATNRPDILDAALVRPGRFDRQVAIDPPDKDGRAAILAVHARGKEVADDVDLGRVAALTPGLSGADLANVMNEAALLATRKGAGEITMGVIEDAIERALLGVSSRRRVMTESEKRTVAYHEAGHALVGFFLPGASPPHKVTIVPRGNSLGYVWHPSEGDRMVNTRSEMIDKMAAGLGGRAAEQLVFGELSDGAGGDLEMITDMAQTMVRRLGMSDELGPLLVADGVGRDGRRRPSYSEETQRLIDQEVRKLVAQAHERARAVLLRERVALDQVAAVLIENETLTAVELAGIVAPPAPIDKAREDQRTAASAAPVVGRPVEQEDPFHQGLDPEAV